MNETVQFPYNLIDDLLEASIRCKKGSEQYKEMIFSVNPYTFLEIMRKDLTKRESDILRLRYTEKISYRALGERYGISATRVQQIVAAAKRKLKRRSKFWKTVPEYQYDATVRRLQTREALSPERRSKLPMSILNLPVRTYNQLYMSGIRTLGQLSECKKSDIYAIKGIDQKTAQFVIERAGDFDIDIPD